MGKLFKILMVSFAGIVVLLIGLAFVLMSVIDPNRYRAAVEQTVGRQSGLQLQIAGDMAWTFRPVFGLSIADVRLRNPDSPQELATFTTISLRVDPAGLLRSELNIEEFLAEDLHINWIVDSQGQGNWPAPGSDNAPVIVESGSAELPMAVNIRQIRVSNARLSVQNLQSGLSMSIRDINLVSRGANMQNQPFPLTMSLNLVDDAAASMLAFSLETTVSFDRSGGHLILGDMALSLSPLSLSGDLIIENLNTNPVWQANLRSNTFPLPHLLANFFATDENTLPPPNQQQLTIHQLIANGDANGLRLESLELEPGGQPGARVSLNADARYATDNGLPRIGYQLSSAAFDLDAWLPSPAAEPVEAASASAADIELPIELLNRLNLQGAHSIDLLNVAGLQFSPMQFTLSLENGLLNLDSRATGFYGGNLELALRLNSRNRPAQLAITSELNNIDAASLSADIPLLNFLTGRFDLNTTHIMSGNSVNALLDNITGSSRILVSESSVNIAILKQVFSAISVLSPSGDMTSAWPDVVPINRTEAVLNFSNGLSSGQSFALRMDNLDIAGTGGINQQEGRFDYQLGFTMLGEPAIQSIRLNENYRDIAWPIRCNAAFSDSAARYCSPDLQKVRDMFAQIARDRLRNQIPSP